MGVNVNGTKVMIGGEWRKVMWMAVRWPCGVCGGGIGDDSMQFTGCHGWVQGKCGGVGDGVCRVMRSFFVVVAWVQ